MNTALITHKLCSSVRKHTVPPPEGTSLHGEKQGYDVSNPASQPTHKRVLHTQPCGGGSSAPSLKVDKVCSRQPVPIRTSDPRGYNTGNVPTSYGPKDVKLYGDAATCESADESTNISKNMRRVPQNEAPAHGFSGGRTAQGTMSRSPEAAAQSGKDYDQETIEISTNKVK